MRKVIFTINDHEFFRKRYDLSPEQMQCLYGNEPGFRAKYTLISRPDNDRMIDRYELTDLDGGKMNINDLIPYQRGVILVDCKRFFEEQRPFIGNGKQPTGVTRIDVQLDSTALVVLDLEEDSTPFKVGENRDGLLHILAVLDTIEEVQEFIKKQGSAG